MPQGFGLTNAGEGILARVFDEAIDLVALLRLVPLPIGVLLFKPGRECYAKGFHFSRRALSAAADSTTGKVPLSVSLSASRSRLALAGLLRRYAVSA